MWQVSWLQNKISFPSTGLSGLIDFILLKIGCLYLKWHFVYSCGNSSRVTLDSLLIFLLSNHHLSGIHFHFLTNKKRQIYPAEKTIFQAAKILLIGIWNYKAEEIYQNHKESSSNPSLLLLLKSHEKDFSIPSYRLFSSTVL